MNKDKILAILETAVDKNGNIPMRLVRQAFEKLLEPCEDAVSRQDAIIQLSHNKNGNPDCDVIIQHDIETLKQLPSVTPKPEPCDDAVSRREAIDAIGEVHPLDYNAQAIKSRIEKLPPVQPKTCEDKVNRMGNRLRQAFGLDEEYNKKVLKWIDEQRKESIKNKECCVCDHFYDYSTGVSTDYGCELPDHNDYAILDKKGCCDWVRRCERDDD